MFWLMQVPKLHLGLMPLNLGLKTVRGALAAKIESSDDSYPMTPTKIAISRVVELRLG
jgi:hypothetical protein